MRVLSKSRHSADSRRVGPELTNLHGSAGLWGLKTSRFGSIRLGIWPQTCCRSRPGPNIASSDHKKWLPAAGTRRDAEDCERISEWRISAGRLPVRSRGG